MSKIKSILANLSHHPGVYQMLGEDSEVLYVGKAKNLHKRVSSYFSGRSKDSKTASLVSQIVDIDISVTQTENEAVLLECNLIKKHRPRYNILLRDDKSYPYILITNQHDFPRIDIYRGQKKKTALYFGPYPGAYAIRETISLLQKIFLIRTCRDSYFATRARPCLLHQIGRCSAPCVDLVTKEQYAKQIESAALFLEGKSELVIADLQQQMAAAADALNFELAKQIRDQINRLRQIQTVTSAARSTESMDVIGYAAQPGLVCIQLQTIRQGQVLGSRSYFPKVPSLADEAEVIAAFITQHYFNHPSHMENIPRQILVSTISTEVDMLQQALTQQAKHKVEIILPLRGDKKAALEIAMQSAKQTLVGQALSKMNIAERFANLKKYLLRESISRMECFDISHSSGEATVASCVVFDQDGPLKSHYRQFNITDITPGDDLAAMQQVILRRYKRLQKEESIMPDVVIIDGGERQLETAKAVFEQLGITGPLLISISKGPDRKAGFETLHFLDRPAMHLPTDSAALHLLQHIRDEAHRFAITGHRHRRDKTRKQSTLELIPGIGTQKRRELLRYFGGIQGIARASLVELCKVPGINRSLAERIFAALHDTTA